MAHIYSLTNQKGGVGKTTTAVNLAASMGAINQKVLLVDMDPQGNATISSGIKAHDLSATIGDLLLKRKTSQEAIITTQLGYDLIGTDGSLTAAEIELMKQDDDARKEFGLQQVLTPLANRYDYILIDCPPALNILTVNVLVAADGVIIPTQCEYFALEGLAALVQTIERVKQTIKPNLVITGVLRTMFDPRNNLAKDVSEQLEQHFGETVYKTIIPRNVTLAEAPSYGLPALQYDKQARGAQAYLMLAGEILNRVTAK